MQSLQEFYESRIPGVTVPVGQGKPKSQTWKRTTIEVVLNEGNGYVKLPWPAYVRESLAVNRAVSFKNTPLDFWHITHVPSGACFTLEYRTKREAIEKADQLLCIEGLWDNPVQSFRDGLSETDCNRVNAILGTRYEPRKVSSWTREYIAHLDSQGGTHVQP